MRNLFILSLVFLLGSCRELPIEVKQSDNPNISIQKMLTIEGCNVYRFYDDRAVYVTICPEGSVAKSSEYQYFEHHNKTTSHYLQQSILAKK